MTKKTVYAALKSLGFQSQPPLGSFLVQLWSVEQWKPPTLNFLQVNV